MKKLIIFLSIIAVGMSCGRFSLYDSDKGAAVVAVGNATLYEDDLTNIYTSQITIEDSVAQREMFIDMWIRNQIKQQRAEDDMNKSLPEIEKMVETYRNSLITHQYEEQFVGAKVDTTVTNDQINQYYKDNIGNFKLAGPLVKAKIARIPSGLRQSDRLSKMFYSSKSSDVEDFLNICNKNDYKLVDFTKEWTDFSTVLHHIPFGNTNFDAFLRSKSIYEVEDDQYKYLMLIESYLLTGSNAPIVSQMANIKKILLHNRRAELIDKLEDSLYKEALMDHVIEFY